jgi:hypothetical protein
MIKARTFVGNPPEGDGWSVLLESKTWRVWSKEGAAGWRQIKVSAVGATQRKANYHTAWNGSVLARSKCVQVAEVHSPELLTWLIGEMRAIDARASASH